MREEPQITFDSRLSEGCLRFWDQRNCQSDGISIENIGGWVEQATYRIHCVKIKVLIVIW